MLDLEEVLDCRDKEVLEEDQLNADEYQDADSATE